MRIDTTSAIDTTTDPSSDPATRSSFIGASLGTYLRGGRIVVAVTGGGDEAGPVRVAETLHRRFGSAVSAVEVIDISDRPLLTPIPEPFTLARNPAANATYLQAALRCRAQLTQWIGAPNEWPIHIVAGAPAYELLRYADAQGAVLVVMGLRRHGTDCVPRDETTLRVARGTRAAVLAVAPTLRTFPRRAIIGVDFGPTSLGIARAALDVLGAPTSDPVVLRLVHVEPPGVTGGQGDHPGAALISRLGVKAAFDQLVTALSAPPGIRVESVVRHGDPAAELLACADESRADLVVVGSLRHDPVECRILGSVTTEIIRDGRHSILVIPPMRPA
jgi:nucleotide-binding universal stress UspA family protein